MQGRKLGLHLIKSLEEIARSQGCYKVILDCSKHNIRGSPLSACAPAPAADARALWPCFLQPSTTSAGELHRPGRSESEISKLTRHRFKHKEFQCVMYLDPPASGKTVASRL